MDALAEGPDGLSRCWWALGGPEYIAYHDEEWGRPPQTDEALFELLCLEAFQAGLSWLTILRKRAAFRTAFSGFRIAEVAAFGPPDVARLLGDAGIVRNRPKIEAAVNNAGRTLEVIAEHGSLATFLWGFRPTGERPPRGNDDIATSTPAAQALARELRRRGFRFLGPTTVYAFMQACGLVNDHIVGCYVREDAERERVAAAARFAARG